MDAHLLTTSVFTGPEWTLDTTGAWSEPGGQTGQTSSGNNQWAAASKIHTCTLRVTDSYGATATMEQTITINREPNVLPVANAGADQTYTVCYHAQIWSQLSLTCVGSS